MKALFILLIALATGAHAQQTTPCLKLEKTEVEKRVLHQNGATQATLTFESKHCYVLGKAENIGRQGPVLEVTLPPGISVTVEGIGVVLFDPAKGSLADFKRGQIAANLQLTATPEAGLGKHSLPVLMHYQVMDGLGNIHDETLAFGIPVKVAPAEHISQPGPGFSERHPVWSKVLLPFEIIAFIPLFILAGLMGWDGC